MLAAAKRALLYLRKNISDDPRIPGAAAIVEADRASLGGNAVGILSISAYTAASGDKEFLNDALRLAKWISATQNQAGKFTVHSQMFSTGDVLSSSLPYFPGEAVFGLCRLSDLDPNGPWLDVAARGLQYMIANNDPEIDMTKVYEDHWLLYAAENVHARKADPRYIAHAKRMVDTITATQKFTDARRPAWNGAYTFPPNANQTATRVEGLCAAYRLFDSVGDRAQAELIRRSIEAACRFQLRQQFRVPEAIRYRNAMHLAGGFQNAPDDPRIRIDTVQHNISSLVGVRKILFPTAPTTAK
jgi:hypothetical protein